jgi:hypothetical protein
MCEGVVQREKLFDRAVDVRWSEEKKNFKRLRKKRELFFKKNVGLG